MNARAGPHVAVGLFKRCSALLGTGLGALLGVFYGWATIVSLRGDGLTAFSVPSLGLVVIIAAGVTGV